MGGAYGGPMGVRVSYGGMGVRWGSDGDMGVRGMWTPGCGVRVLYCGMAARGMALHDGGVGALGWDTSVGNGHGGLGWDMG